MLPEGTIDKIKELTSKAVSINEELLGEERKFIEAVAGHEDISKLNAMVDKITTLFRKEGLFIGAAKNLLKQVGSKTSLFFL